MNFNELNAEIARNGLSIPKLASLIGISKKAMYARMRGNVDFSQSEIVKISDVLHLNNDRILSIFFADKVS